MKKGGIFVLIVAGGQGVRARRYDGEPAKQYIALLGQTVISRSIEAFLKIDEINGILPVIHKNDFEVFATSIEDGFDKIIDPVVGGATRQQSVMAGLLKLQSFEPDAVLIHDAVRPFCSKALIQRSIGALKDRAAVLPVLPVVETLKSVRDNHVERTLSRNQLYRAQTPQCFEFSRILAAHKKALSETKQSFTDDASIAEWAGIDVYCIEGEENNIKITDGEDFKRAEMILGQSQGLRVGQGYDVHRFGPGASVTLCGVEIEFNKGLQGHSDADVGMHAITDAIYGAIAEGDIGQHFPPSDAQWRGAASRIFLDHAVSLCEKKGGRILNVDVTLVCEMPKIGPHAMAMRQTLGEIMSLEIDQVSVKATTSEKLGFTGRGEGIAAMAIATLQI